MQIVMIHEVTPRVLKADLSKFDIITFDDGLYTQYLHHEHFAKFNKPMYFFISTNIVCSEDVKQDSKPLYCGAAHEQAFKGNFKNYMTWSQIEELSELYNIGGHSHNHPRIYGKSLSIQHAVCNFEVQEMLRSFSEHNIKIDSFCYPYNEEVLSYKAVLKGFKFFGKERVEVELL